MTKANVKFALFHLYISIAIFSYNLASATLSERRAATWNLQGTSASAEEKWNRNVKHLIKGDEDVAVLALQESGPPPNSATTQGPLRNRLINPQDLDQEVHEYKWNIGTARRSDIRWIYYTHNDRGENRANLALVTKDRPDYVILLRPPSDQRSIRPILGVQFDKDNYFTIHASDNRDGDAADIVNLIVEYFGSREKYDHQFMIMGDYNQNPDDLRSSLNRQHSDILEHIGIYHTNTPTQNGGGIVDYAVLGEYNYDLPNHLRVHVSKPSCRGHMSSDHKPVAFNIDEDRNNERY